MAIKIETYQVTCKETDGAEVKPEGPKRADGTRRLCPWTFRIVDDDGVVFSGVKRSVSEQIALQQGTKFAAELLTATQWLAAHKIAWPKDERGEKAFLEAHRYLGKEISRRVAAHIAAANVDVIATEIPSAAWRARFVARSRRLLGEFCKTIEHRKVAERRVDEILESLKEVANG